MAPTTTDTVRVPGAHLYYEVRGSGPVLLLICGGVYDAAGYAGLAEQLADRYTVHEPPLFELLPDRDRFRVVVRNVEEAFVEKGTEAAGQILAAGLPMSGGRQENEGEERIPGGEEAPQGEPDTELMEMMARLEKSMEFFLGYEVRPFATYSPDLAALRASSTRIVAAVGEDSDGEPPSRAALALAERLGTWAVPFPGDHGGFGINTEAFAAKLDELLEVSR